MTDDLEERLTRVLGDPRWSQPLADDPAERARAVRGAWRRRRAVRRAGIATIGLVAMIAAGLGGWALSGQQHAAEITVTGPPTTPGRPAGSLVPPCRASQVRVAVVGTTAATGRVFATFGFTNESAMACSLSGYPVFGALDSAGRPIPLHISHGVDPATGATNSVTVVTVPPGHQAEFVAQWEENGNPCPAVGVVLIGPPGSAQPSRIPSTFPNLARFDPCGQPPGVNLSPIQPSRPSTTGSAPPNPVGSGPDIYFVDARHGWAGWSGGIVATIDGGNSWQLQYRATPENIDSGILTGVGTLDFLDTLHGWAVDAGTLIETSNGGLLWRTVGKPQALIGASQLRFFDAQHGWAVIQRVPCSDTGCTTEGSIMVTGDGGLTWTHAAVRGSVLAMCWASPTVGWASGGAALDETTDAGRTWTYVKLPGFYPAPVKPDQGAGTTITTIACSGSTAWVLGSQGVATGHEGYTVDRTLDGGAHWQPVLGGVDTTGLTSVGDYAGAIAAPTSQTAYFVGYCNGCDPVQTSFTTTTDGGRTFQHYPVNPNALLGESPAEITFPDSRHGWAFGSIPSANPPSAVIYATTDGGRTWHLQYRSTA